MLNASVYALLYARYASNFLSMIREDGRYTRLEAETLIQEMVKHDLGYGRVLYSYDAPSSDGIYLVPYIVQSQDNVTLYVSVRHLGQSPQNFPGVDIMPDEDTTYHIRPEAQQVTVTEREGGGFTEQFDELVGGETLKALRIIGRTDGGGVKIIFPREGGSNDDRLLTAIECQQVDHILKLYQYLQEKKECRKLCKKKIGVSAPERMGILRLQVPLRLKLRSFCRYLSFFRSCFFRYSI